MGLSLVLVIAPCCPLLSLYIPPAVCVCPYSRDCPIFYMRKKVQKDLTEQDKTISRFSDQWWCHLISGDVTWSVVMSSDQWWSHQNPDSATHALQLSQIQVIYKHIKCASQWAIFRSDVTQGFRVILYGMWLCGMCVCGVWLSLYSCTVYMKWGSPCSKLVLLLWCAPRSVLYGVHLLWSWQAPFVKVKVIYSPLLHMCSFSDVDR